MQTFITFDGPTIAYHDEGEGSPVILLHGYGVDGLGQFGNFERILLLLEKRQTLFIEAFGELRRYLILRSMDAARQSKARAKQDRKQETVGPDCSPKWIA